MSASPADAALPARSVSDRLYLVPIAMAVVAFALVAYFDLQTNLPFNDEYAHRWTIQRLIDGHGIALWGTNPGLVQIALGATVGLTHAEPRYWRLAVLPLLAVEAYFSWRIARRLGADRFWAAVAATLILAAPITLSLATGLMTETAFLGLFMAAIWFSVKWVLDGRDLAWCLVFAWLATAQRPQGAGLVLGVALGLLMVKKSRRVTSRDLVGLGLLCVGVFLAYYVPPHYLYPVATPGAPLLTAPSQVAIAVANIVDLPIVLGLLLMPLLIGLWPKTEGEARRLGRLEMIPVGICFAGLVGAAKSLLALGATSLLPGPIFGSWGLGPPLVPGSKQALVPTLLFSALQVVVVATAVILLIRRRRAWDPRLLTTAEIMLVVFAISQFLPLLLYKNYFDRYFVEVAAPVVPMLAALISRSHRHPRLSAGWAVALIAIGVGYYAIGQQDYTAWQVARDQAARIAYAHASAEKVQAGYEEIAVHVWIPAAEHPGLPMDVVEHPDWILAFAPPGDPRPGVRYESLAPGKILVLSTR
jgi:hypothetical protein